MPFDVVAEPMALALPPLPVIEGIEIRQIAEAPWYAVTSQGQVLSCCKKRGGIATKWKKHSDCATKFGHQFVLLRIDGHSHRRAVHRLVLTAFVGPCPEGMQCRHLNGIPWDNRPCNLAWGTVKENSDDTERHGTRVRGSRSSRAKLTEEQVAEIRSIFASGERDRKAIAARFGVTASLVSQVLAGKTWVHVEAINYHDAMTSKGQTGREFTGFGLRFRAARRSAKLSHADIARVCGCSKQAVSLWECGFARPSGDRLRIACELMGVTMASIINDGPRPADDTTEGS